MSNGAAQAAAIGAEVRSARRARGLSMRALAALTGVSQPFVSKIENGQIFPSLQTLRLLAAALEVAPATLLPAAERIERAPFATEVSARPVSATLLGGEGRRLQAVRVELAAGTREPRPHLHAGEDFVRVVEGSVEVLREGLPTVMLGAGEVLRLDGAVPHRLAAGTTRALALVVLIGAGAHHDG